MDCGGLALLSRSPLPFFLLIPPPPSPSLLYHSLWRPGETILGYIYQPKFTLNKLECFTQATRRPCILLAWNKTFIPKPLIDRR